MANYVEVPPSRLGAGLLRALLEEYVTRDGTDYGNRELSLDEKVQRLQGQLDAGDVRLLYESESEQWDLVPSRDAARLLDS
ncbi:MAG: YheU family protein [Halioglobus sp.]|nr:YheU family protein [Halioglobus sp.]